jgi:hypothetical protein
MKKKPSTPRAACSLSPEVLDDVLAFGEWAGVALFDWQREALAQAWARVDGAFRYRLAGISVPRGNGKSLGLALIGAWRLVCGPAPQGILSAALDYDGAKVVLDHARRIVRQNPALSKAIEVQANALIVKGTGSRWTITSRAHTASRGQHCDAVLYDEAGWPQDDDLFSSLLAGQASVSDPICVIASTVGRRQSGPLWTVRTLHGGGDDGVFWDWRGDNPSPKVTEKYLARQRRILVASQYAREHQNAWVDGCNALVTTESVDHAMGHGWVEQYEGRAATSYHAFVDLGLVHDPTVCAVGHEEDGCIYIDRLLTFQGSKGAPVQIATIEAALMQLAEEFSLTCIRVESWQGVAVAERLVGHGLPVTILNPTPKTNATEWPVLAQTLAAGRLVLFPHARLREELLNLVVEVGPSGTKVSDRGKVHQDHAVAVRGVVASLSALGEGAGIVAAVNLSRESRYIGIVGDPNHEMSEADGYRLEQEQWAREAARNEFPDGGPLVDYGPSIYSRRSWRDDF